MTTGKGSYADGAGGGALGMLGVAALDELIPAEASHISDRLTTKRWRLGVVAGFRLGYQQHRPCDPGSGSRRRAADFDGYSQWAELY